MKKNIGKITYTTFMVLTLISLIQSIYLKNLASVGLSAIALFTLSLPNIIKKIFKLEIPALLEVLLYIFIYAGIVLGSVYRLYDNFEMWDNILHYTSGILTSLIAYSLIYILGKKNNLSISLILIFCFSFSLMTGVIWEFIEFTCDNTIRGDMQKDTIVDSIATTIYKDRLSIKDIDYTIIYSKGQEYRIDNGYLDIGLFDTIKDLFANFLGAITYVILMYYHLAKNKLKFMNNLVIKKAS